MSEAMRKALALHSLPSAVFADSVTDMQDKALNRRSLTDDSWAFKVERFSLLFVPDQCYSHPQMPTAEEIAAVREHVDSEMAELVEAGSPADVLDAVLDSIYFQLNFLIKQGIPARVIDLAMEEIHASNMTKTDDEGRPVINDGIIDPAQPVGKVLKGANYVKADIQSILDN